MLSEAEVKHLRWRCTHRALREMDLLLGFFMERHFDGLDAEDQAAFAALAEMEDLDLWRLIAGRRECSDPARARVLALLHDARPA